MWNFKTKNYKSFKLKNGWKNGCRRNKFENGRENFKPVTDVHMCDMARKLT